MGANVAAAGAALVNGVGAALEVHLVGESGVIKLPLLAQVLEVGNSKGDTDAEQNGLECSSYTTVPALLTLHCQTCG